MPPQLPATTTSSGSRADLDRWMRRLLGLPGVLVDWLDGERVTPRGAGPEEVYPLVVANAQRPEAHLALERGLHYFVHQGAVAAYDVRGATAFAIGGLNIGAGARGPFIRALLAAVQAAGAKRLLVFPLHDDELEECARAGLAALQVGVEGWLDLPHRFEGSAFSQVRYMNRRAGRRGVRVEEADPDAHGPAMGALHDAWLLGKRPSWRMKLLVGSPSLEAPFDRRYLVARSSRGLEGFVTLLPGPGGAWGLDVMCRRPDAVPGTMERLLVHAAALLAEEGATALSLGACPMAGVPRQGDRPLLRWTFDALYRSTLGNRVFGFASLHRFKKKFRPRWTPVYFGATPTLGVKELYLGCRMWGLY